MSRSSYPQIGLRSKNEIVKRISPSEKDREFILRTLNEVLENFDNHWYDSRRSDPVKGKFVRSAAKSPQLDKILSLVNDKILEPYDSMVPSFIFGGLSERNNIKAAGSLLGKKRGRVLIKLDIQSFFEQINEERVFHFFHSRCGCTVEASRLLSKLCCVPKGKKGSGSHEKILARGFATSARLAMWCNLTTFQHLEWLIKKKLKGRDPEIAIYVDDIGITASRVDINKMEEVRQEAIFFLENFDRNQPLPAHRGGDKSFVKTFSSGAEHLGIKFGRNKLSLGWKTRSRTDKLKAALEATTDPKEKIALLAKYKARKKYKRQVETFGNNL